MQSIMNYQGEVNNGIDRSYDILGELIFSGVGVGVGDVGERTREHYQSLTKQEHHGLAIDAIVRGEVVEF